MNLFRRRGLSQNDGDTDLLRRGPFFLRRDFRGFSRETEFAASICTGFQNSKNLGKKLENPSGRTYNKTICVRRSLEKDQPFMPMPRDASGVYKELLLNMESQGNRRRYGLNHKALETIFGHPQGLLPPEESNTNIM